MSVKIIQNFRPSSALLLALVCFPSWSSAEGISPQELVSSLQGGGHVIYLRHASTESDYADQVTATPSDCATQRVLSEVGWAQAKAIGAAINALNIPVSEVVSSEYCRAWQTADLAFGQYRKDPALNFVAAAEYTDEEFARMGAGVTPYLMPKPASGNRILVGHDDPFEAATGIYPEPRGVAYVLKPLGDSFEVIGRIGPDEWPVQ